MICSVRKAALSVLPKCKYSSTFISSRQVCKAFMLPLFKGPLLNPAVMFNISNKWAVSMQYRVTAHLNCPPQLSPLEIESGIRECDVSTSETLYFLEELAFNTKFSPSKRLELLNYLWTKMLQHAVILDQNHFILKLECYLRSRYKIAPKDFKRETEQAGVQLSEAMLKLLLEVVAEHGDPGYVSSVVTSMKSRNLTADDSVFASLIIAHAVRGDMSSARQVIQTMKECRVEPGEKTYGALMRAAVMAGDYAALHTAKTNAEQKGFMSTRSILTILDTLVRSGKLHLLPSMEASVKQCPASEILKVAETLVFSGFASGGYLVSKLVPDLSAEQYSSFILTMFTASIPVSKILCVCGDMVSDRVYHRALYDALECVLKEGNVSNGLRALQACKDRDLELRQHYFWPLVASAAQSKGEQGVYEILEKMASMNCPADADTLTEMALSRLSFDEADAVLLRLRDITGMPLSQLLVPFLAHLVKCGMTSQALSISERYRESILDSRSASLLRALAIGYSSSGNDVSTIKMLKILRVFDVSDWLATILNGRKGLSANELLTLLKTLKKERCFITDIGHRWLHRKLSQAQVLSAELNKALDDLASDNKEVGIEGRTPPSTMPHPDDMTMEELECHIIELEAKGMNTRGALRRLLQASCRSGDAKKARNAYQQLVDGGMVVSPGILASLLEAYVKSALPDDAIDVLKKLEVDFPKFSLDSYKILDLATLLVKQGRMDEALTLVQDHPQGRSSMKAKSSWERNVWELLIASEAKGGVSAVQNMFNLVINCNYSAPTNVVCGPLVKAYLKSNDVEGAVKIFSQLAERHKVTPLQQELMQAVISSDKVHLLDGLVQAASKVHGNTSAQAVLILALAHHGDPSILRQYLTNGHVNMESDQLKNQMQRALELGQVNALKTLLVASWDVPRMDADHLISLILKHFHRKGDSEGALTYWKELEELGIDIDKHRASLAALVAASAKT